LHLQNLLEDTAQLKSAEAVAIDLPGRIPINYAFQIGHPAFNVWLWMSENKTIVALVDTSSYTGT